MQFVLLTPAQQVAAFAVARVTVDGASGQFGVLPGHMPLVSLLAPNGTIVAESETGVETTYTVSDGVVDVTPTTVTVLAESVLRGV